MAAVDASGGPASITVTGTGVDPGRVLERLDRVHDPELDRSIVELDYVERIALDGGEVGVTFVLPTAWCSPAFAWMMATDVREEVGRLPGVDRVTVELRDHMHGEQITEGVNAGRPFEAVFEDADDGVEAIRDRLDRRARFARQHAAMDALLGAGIDDDQLAGLTLGDVELATPGDRAAVAVREGTVWIEASAEPLERYLEKARETGEVVDAADAVFLDRDGAPVDPDEVQAVRRDARLAVANIDGQATICGSLHEARQGEGRAGRAG